MLFFKRKTPYRLSEGLFLEDSSTLLAWNTPFENLASTASERSEKNPRTTILLWRNREIFGSWRVDIECSSYRPNVFFLHIKSLRVFHEAEGAHDHILEVVRKKFGKPSFSLKKSENGYPLNEWHYGNVKISLTMGESFYQYVSLSVQRTAAPA